MKMLPAGYLFEKSLYAQLYCLIILCTAVISATPIQGVAESIIKRSIRSTISEIQSATSSKDTVVTLPTFHNGCASPEVLVNGAPSPEIVDTVGGGNNGFANIQEIQFVGVVGPLEQKRICKIKCLNGVWVGPLCALEHGWRSLWDLHIQAQPSDIECPPIDGSLDANRVMSVDGNKLFQRARFSCVEGYLLDGQDDIVCTSNGFWSHPPPKCKAIECPEILTDDPYLRIAANNRSLGGRATFSCPDGYKLSGPNALTCLDNNSWSDEVPGCEAIDCQPPLPPVNGRVLDSGHFRTGDYVQFLCNTGYVLVGESLSVCMENGTWSRAVPICKPSCEFPGEPPNGYVVPTKFHYSIGESISIVCKGNFRLHGPSLAYCNPNGRWSIPLPSCK